MTDLLPPPLQERTSDNFGKFPQLWVRWLSNLYTCITDIISDLNGLLTYRNALGWGYYDDSTYTEASPLSVNNARVQVEIDGLNTATETGYLPSSGDLWDTTNNKILMPTIGDGFIFRLDWKAKSSNQNSYYSLELDIGDGSSIVIAGRTYQMVHGINQEQRFTDTITGFALDTFVANGGKLYFDSTQDGANISVYDLGIKVEKTYAS
jgi:hypothetical protein